MKLYTKRRGSEVVLIAVPEKEDNLCAGCDFARCDKPLKATIRRYGRTKKRYFEIRKEQT